MPIRVLQFSDIHFSTKHGATRNTHDDVREQVLNDLAAMQITGVDAIVIAGDVAFSGKREEYQAAANWIERVRAQTGCPRNAVLSVPGNHDVDRDRINLSTKLVHRSLRHASLPQALGEIAQLADLADPCLLDKIAEYQAFAGSYGCFFRSPSRPMWTRSFQLTPSRTLSFVGLSTVQVCDDDDAKDAMLLGNHQFIIPRAMGTEQIVVMHHPVDWLKDKTETLKYLNSRARVVIVGHEHVQDLHKISTPRGEERLVVASGALTPPESGSPFEYRYNVLDFDSSPAGVDAQLIVTVIPRVWSQSQTAFEADHDCVQTNDRSTVTLRCPQFDTPGAIDPDANAHAMAENLCHLRFLFWRKLGWQSRLRVLVSTKMLPSAEEAPLPHGMEERALREAESGGHLHALWESMMLQMNADDRLPNPFPQPE